MKKEIFKREDVKLGVTLIILGGIFDLFIESGMDIAILIMFSYIGHKYIEESKNEELYKNYEFIDEEKYKNGLKKFAIFVDIYVVIRIVSIILSKYNSYTTMESILIFTLLIPYEKYLSKKYVKCIHNKDENIKRVFIKYKFITIILCIAFMIFTVAFFKDINEGKEKGFVKVFNYEYRLTLKNNKREVLTKSNSIKSKAIENNKNEKYFDTYINKAKRWIDFKVLKVYSYFGMGFMFLMILIQNIKYKTEYEVISTMQMVFITGFIIFSMIGISDIHSNIENDLLTYMSENIH
ncbi:hypothetical protein [Paraclostridium tenue]|uniref:Uncharacterized protein n=1 Tax=Paraclostridium tenue TaxID=1737 RepID=A0ABN1M4F4_9FIRM